jgi:hypothetical protein
MVTGYMFTFRPRKVSFWTARKLNSCDLTVNMSFQQSCAKLSSKLVEKLSANLCSDVAEYIMSYVSLERDMAERLKGTVFAAVGPELVEVPNVETVVMWDLHPRADAMVIVKVVTHYDVPGFKLYGEEAMEFANRFMLRDGGDVRVVTECGEVVSVVSAQW